MNEAFKILILDGKGGGIGRKVAERLLQENLRAQLIVTGSNAAATSNMMKAGVATGATGENAWLYNCDKADMIIGPVGVIVAHSMHGEISPQMAIAVSNSLAEKILIPVSNHHFSIVGMPELKLPQILDKLVELVKNYRQK